MDVLSDVLRVIRLTGAVLFRASFGAPWAISTQGADGLLSQFPPRIRCLTVFHVVMSGRCWIGRPHGPAEPIDAGHAVVLPRCDVHVLGDDPARSPVPTQILLHGAPLGKLRDVRYGGDGPRTQMLCGFLTCEQGGFEPLFAALPSLFRVSLESVRGLLDYAQREAVSEAEGAASSRLRIAELLFVEALRRYMAGLRRGEIGWLAGLRDPVVGRALALLHADPRRRWTVEALASRAAASRSSLNARFTQLLGEPPMQYLANWRLFLAARRLNDERATIEAIALDVGYRSPAAFQRAFKRRHGETPAVYRKRQRAATANVQQTGKARRPAASG